MTDRLERRALPEQGNGVAHSLRPIHLVAIGMGTTIGAGWIVAGGSWILNAGPAGAAIAFAIGGMIFLCIALVYADLACSLPDAGSELAYADAILGPVAAFWVGWMLLLGFVAICSFEGIAMASLVTEFVPNYLGPEMYRLGDAPIHLLELSCVLVGTLFFAAVNLVGTVESARVQLLTTTAKILLCTGIILVAIKAGSLDNLDPPFAAAGPSAAIASVLITIPAWFCGFNAAALALNEAREPIHPRRVAAILMAIVAITAVFYVLVNLAIGMAAPRAELAAARLPVVEAIRATSGRTGTMVLLATGTIALASAWNAALYASSRLVFTMAARRELPALLGRLSRGIPRAAILSVALLSAIAGLAGRRLLEPLIGLAAIGFALAFLATCMAGWRVQRSGRSTLNLPLPVCAAAVASSGAVLLLAIADIVINRANWADRGAVLAGWIVLGLALHAFRPKNSERATP